jgi:hypothetical protein
VRIVEYLHPRPLHDSPDEGGDRGFGVEGNVVIVRSPGALLRRRDGLSSGGNGLQGGRGLASDRRIFAEAGSAAAAQDDRHFLSRSGLRYAAAFSLHHRTSIVPSL